jgi:hypothetical protein
MWTIIHQCLGLRGAKTLANPRRQGGGPQGRGPAGTAGFNADNDLNCWSYDNVRHQSPSPAEAAVRASPEFKGSRTKTQKVGIRNLIPEALI